MEKQSIVTLEITDITEEGDGIGRHEGMAVFVAEALPGETVNVRISTVKKNFAKGRIVEVVTPSPYRVEPKCSIAKMCGGCQIQALEYAQQVKWKQSHVMACMERIAGLENPPVKPIIAMEDPWNYRNKAHYPVGGTVEAPLIGFYAYNSHQIVEANPCQIQPLEYDAIIKTIKELIKTYQIKPYNPDSHKGLLRHVMLRSNTEGKVMVVLVTSGRPIVHRAQVVEALTQKHPAIETIIENNNPYKDHRILGSKNHVLHGSGVLEDRINDLSFEISPQSFYQVNPVQTTKLYQKALEYANLKGHETVLDLYCGIGTISLFLAKKAQTVIGVEIVSEAIQNAKKNAENNTIENVEFITGTAEAELPKLLAKGMKPDVVVMDPPRKGCEKAALTAILQMAPERIVYVSCKPSTLARDLKILVEGGYTVEEIQPVDQFPHTGHVEAIILMTRSGSGTKK